MSRFKASQGSSTPRRLGKPSTFLQTSRPFLTIGNTEWIFDRSAAVRASDLRNSAAFTVIGSPIKPISDLWRLDFDAIRETFSREWFTKSRKVERKEGRKKFSSASEEKREGGVKIFKKSEKTRVVSQRYFILDEFQPVIPGNPRVCVHEIGVINTHTHTHTYMYIYICTPVWPVIL